MPTSLPPGKQRPCLEWARRFTPTPRRGEGGGVTMIPHRNAGATSSHLLPRGEQGVKGSASLKTQRDPFEHLRLSRRAHGLSNLLGAPGGLGHEEAHIGLRGDEADAFPDESERALGARRRARRLALTA